MARFAPLPYPGRTAPVATRSPRNGTFAQATAVGAVLLILAAIGSLVFRLAHRVQQGLRAWAEQRRQRAEDRKLWDLALSDPRVMADLVALSQHETRGTSRFF
jgi:hypothetical protein